MKCSIGTSPVSLVPSRYLNASRGLFSRSEYSIRPRLPETSAPRVHHDVVQRGGQVHLRSIRGGLMVRRVDAHLRLDRDGPRLIAAGDVKALHLHVAENFEVVAPIDAKQRGIDAPAFVAELPLEQVFGKHEVLARRPLRRPDRLLEKLSPLLAGEEKQRVVLHLARQAHFDVLDFEVGVGGELPVGSDPIGKTDRSLHQLLRGKNPVELVQRPGGQARVVLHPALESIDDGGLGRAVRPMQQDELVDPPGANEVAQHPIERVLNLLLSGDPDPALATGGVEDAEAADLPARVGHLIGPEVIHRVPQVLRRVARLFSRFLEEEAEVFLEGKNAAVFDEVRRNVGADRLQETLRLHLIFLFRSIWREHPHGAHRAEINIDDRLSYTSDARAPNRGGDAHSGGAGQLSGWLPKQSLELTWEPRTPARRWSKATIR